MVRMLPEDPLPGILSQSLALITRSKQPLICFNSLFLASVLSIPIDHWDDREKFEQALVRFLPGIDWDAVLTPAAGGLQLLGLMGAFGTAVRDALGTVDWGLTFTTLWAGLSDGIGAGLLARRRRR